ncbi:hypothetical protein Tco_1176439 [Tanacetum coccineum]
MPGEEPAPQMAPVETPQMVSTIKLPILKKGEYTLWSIRMEQYLTNTDYGLWEVILNGDGPIQVIRNEDGIETEVPPKTAQAILARQRERKAKSILLLAIPDEYQLSLLKVHGAVVSNEDANQKFLRALPSSWNNIALIMRNKDGIDDLDIDDLYDNLKVLEADIKGSSGSSSNSQNVAFLSAEDISSTNEVNTANGVSTVAGYSSQGQASSSSYANDLMFSFFANQTNSLQLDDDDLEQIDHDDLEEMDLKWQVAMLSMRNGDARNRSRDNTRRTIPVETSDALVLQDNALIVQDGLGYDWSYMTQDEPTEFALMAYTSSSSGSDTEVQSCSKKYYQLGLESVEAQLIVHQKNEVVYEEKIAVLEFKYEASSKNLNKLIDSQMSAKDKTGLGYGGQIYENNSSGSEVIHSVFDSHSSDEDDNQTNDRFKKVDGYHIVPPPFTQNYMPPLTDLSFAGLDDSVYRPLANKTSASVSKDVASIS